jgi:translin
MEENKQMERLEEIVEEIRNRLDAQNKARDLALQRSRELIRFCAHTIRAIHREEFDKAEELLAKATEAARVMVGDLEHHPTVYFAGYTQDSLKELVEASITYAIVKGEPIPSPDDLNVPEPAYLGGLSEAATELRRHTLDLVRKGRLQRAEELLDAMDDIYSYLVTIDFPDAITGGLRRNTDILRSVMERTRGELTVISQQQKLQEALAEFEERMNGR